MQWIRGLSPRNAENVNGFSQSIGDGELPSEQKTPKTPLPQKTLPPFK
jgi:hypothetical protein